MQNNNQAHQLLLQLTNYLQDAVSAHQEFKWLVEHITRCPYESLYASGFVLSSDTYELLHFLIEQRVVHHKPLAYLLGNVPFCNVTLELSEPVHIPRPETEEMCEWIINTLTKENALPHTILDIGTGSGCIALSLAKAFPHSTVVGIDISPSALMWARHNATLNNCTNVTFHSIDIMNHIPEAQFDLIVSNPPYIAPSEKQLLDLSVQLWEDPLALFASDEGFAFYKRLAQVTPLLSSHPTTLPFHVVLEHGYLQKEKIAHIFTEHIPDSTVISYLDLSKKERWLSITLP